MADLTIRAVARFVVATLLGCLVATGTARAQDPLKVLPESYRLDFENEWVRVVHVRYAPHAKLPVHDHPKTATAYVYLNDGGPVVFKHIGLSYGAITRPATVAGSFRLAKAVQEVHEVENRNDSPSEFLRVEFKQLPPGASPLRGKYFPEAYPPGENVSKVHFENEPLRVTRRACAPGKPCDLSSSTASPVLLVALASGRLTSADQTEPLVVAPGQTEWLEAGTRRVVENREAHPLEFLTFEFKTAAGTTDGHE